MKMEATRVRDKASAIGPIVSGGARLLDLDYESAVEDVIELGKLGRAHGVSVMLLSHEAIVVEGLTALKSALQADKETWRIRVFLCQFPLSAVPLEERIALLGRAAELQDMIIPSEAAGMAGGSQWAH